MWILSRVTRWVCEKNRPKWCPTQPIHCQNWYVSFSVGKSGPKIFIRNSPKKTVAQLSKNLQIWSRWCSGILFWGSLDFQVYSFYVAAAFLEKNLKSLGSVMKKKTIVLFENLAMWMWNQRPLHVQEDAGHPGWQGGSQEKNNWKKWRAKK
jgi:hypothetical protein